MRKKAQAKKRSSSSSKTSPTPPSAAVSSPTQSSSSSNITTVESLPFPDSTTGVESFYDTGGLVVSTGDNDDQVKAKTEEKKHEEDHVQGCYSMDDIWEEISLPEVNDIGTFNGQEGGYNCNNLSSYPLMAAQQPPPSSSWDDQFFCSDSLWKTNLDEEVSKGFFSPISTNDHQFNFACFEYEGAYLTG